MKTNAEIKEVALARFKSSLKFLDAHISENEDTTHSEDRCWEIPNLKPISICGSETIEQYTKDNILCFQILSRSLIERIVNFLYLFYSDDTVIIRYLEHGFTKMFKSAVSINEFYNKKGKGNMLNVDSDIFKEFTCRLKEFSDKDTWSGKTFSERLDYVSEQCVSNVDIAELDYIKHLYREHSTVVHGSHFGNIAYTGEHFSFVDTELFELQTIVSISIIEKLLNLILISLHRRNESMPVV